MKSFILTLTAASLTALSPAAVHGLGLDLGPFSIQLFPNSSGIPVQVDNFADSICYAIETQRPLDMIVEVKESVNKNEFKIISKKITVNPYLFGIGHEGQPVLQGDITSEKLIKEVTVKLGENENGPNNPYWAAKYPEDYTGKYISYKDKNNVATINFSKIADFHVIRDAHFKAPASLDINEKEVAKVICRINVPVE